MRKNVGGTMSGILFALCVGIFLFGFAHGVFAETCVDAQGSVKKEGFTCTASFADTGGSNLASCDYRVYDTGNAPSDWRSITGCKGSFVELDIDVEVRLDSSYGCTATGDNACTLETQATDVAGNISSAQTFLFDINLNTAPIANNDSYSTNEDTALTVAAPGVL
ncbi:MAG: hypothetical protein HY482_02550, partial [Candidatus Wildermuthbacteria bacterium]|nr:hypothetical protein [Candidatus Wildermuthbacteria bacterium]